MNVVGTLIKKDDTQNVSASFQKRDFVIEFVENPQYPQFIKFQLVQDRCALVDAINLGDKIDVSFNLRGRKWTNPQGEEVYFNSLEAWRIEKQEAAQNIPSLSGEAGPSTMPPVEMEDDLPF